RVWRASRTSARPPPFPVYWRRNPWLRTCGNRRSRPTRQRPDGHAVTVELLWTMDGVTEGTNMTGWDGVTDGTQMTEWEWLDCTDSQPMLKFLRKKVSDRKLHLFAEACRGRVTNLSR